VSTSSSDARDRIPDVEYRLVDGTTVIAMSKGDLLDGQLDHAVDMDAWGNTLNDTPWTGTASDGSFSGASCGDWTHASDSVRAMTGSTTYRTLEWTKLVSVPCRRQIHLPLYCFQTSLWTPRPTQTPTPTSTPTFTPLPVKKVFVAHLEMNGKMGISPPDYVGLRGADYICSWPNHHYYAWLSLYGRTPAEFFSNARYVLVDGTVVANSLADLTDGSLLHPINKDLDGNTVSPGYAWTGTSSLGYPNGPNCHDWLSSSPLVKGRVGWVGSTSGYWTDDQEDKNCFAGRYIYCFEK